MANTKLTGNFLATARCLIFADGGGIVWSFNPNTNTLSAASSGGGISGLANPTAKVGLVAVNGSLATAMRSDGSPPIDQAILPTWTGLHTFSSGLTVSSGATTINGHTLTLSANATVGGTNTGDQSLPIGANPSASVGLSAVNGSATTWMRSDGAPALSVTISPTWTGNHTFSPSASGGTAIVISTTGTATGLAVLGAAASQVTGVSIGQTGQTIWQFYQPASSNDLRFFTSVDAVIFKTAGSLQLASGVGVNGNSPPAQSTGWGTPTGAVVNNYNGAAATLLQTSDALGQLLSVLKAVGILGA